MTVLSFETMTNDVTCDVAIVGAGVSGLYCAWRLLRSKPDLKITIVERLDRTGGRLDSDIVEVTPGEKVREEEGGMRFNYDMVELMTLNAALGICDQIVPFPMGSKKMPNRFNLRGHCFTLKDAADSDQMIWSEIYNLKPEEIGLSPTDLVTIAYRNVLYANGMVYKSGTTPKEWAHFRDACYWKGTPMKSWQLWGLLRDMDYSEECIQMLTETIGFAGPFKSMANAGDAFQILADFPKDPAYFTFQHGFNTLPNTLRDQMLETYGENIQIMTSANVDQITRSQDGYALQISQAVAPVNARPVMMGQSKTVTLSCNKVIMASASKGSQDLFTRSPALRDAPEAEKLWDALYASLGMKLMKINLYYTNPWWHDGQTGRAQVKFGPNFSNLPVNAVYPFYALPKEGDTEEIRDQAPAALTIYCDFDNTNFWHGLQNVGEKFSSALQDKQNAKTPQVMYPASNAVVSEARVQLAALFGTNTTPEPVLTSYRLWDGQEDFEFAYHQWKLNADDRKIRAYLANPMAGLYVCNEAFSDMHGWVNGSLRSSNDALEKITDDMQMALKPLDDAPCTKTETPVAPRYSIALWGG